MHAVSKGKPVTVSIDAGEGSEHRKIYQCLDILKTIVPLKTENGRASAKFPDPSTPESKQMAFTFCVGLEREGDRVRYAEQRYNPYQTTHVSLNWQSIGKDELYEKLQVLSPANSMLINDLKKEDAYIQQQLKIREKTANVRRELQAVLDRREREAAMMRRLLRFIDQCDNNRPVGEEVAPVKSNKSDVFPSSGTVDIDL